MTEPGEVEAKVEESEVTVLKEDLHILKRDLIDMRETVNNGKAGLGRLGSTRREWKGPR